MEYKQYIHLEQLIIYFNNKIVIPVEAQIRLIEWWSSSNSISPDNYRHCNILVCHKSYPYQRQWNSWNWISSIMACKYPLALFNASTTMGQSLRIWSVKKCLPLVEFMQSLQPSLINKLSNYWTHTSSYCQNALYLKFYHGIHSN